MTAESLRSANKGYRVEKYSHGNIRHGAETWHWRLHNHKQLLTGQINKYRPAGVSHENQFCPETKYPMPKNAREM